MLSKITPLGDKRASLLDCMMSSFSRRVRGSAATSDTDGLACQQPPMIPDANLHRPPTQQDYVRDRLAVLFEDWFGPDYLKPRP